MDKLSQVVKAFTVQAGAQIVGIASVEVMNQFLPWIIKNPSKTSLELKQSFRLGSGCWIPFSRHPTLMPS